LYRQPTKRFRDSKESYPCLLTHPVREGMSNKRVMSKQASPCKLYDEQTSSQVRGASLHASFLHRYGHNQGYKMGSVSVSGATSTLQSRPNSNVAASFFRLGNHIFASFFSFRLFPYFRVLLFFSRKGKLHLSLSNSRPVSPTITWNRSRAKDH
jgi:hypothetical protein